jgi:hypothetical protein
MSRYFFPPIYKGAQKQWFIIAQPYHYANDTQNCMSKNESPRPIQNQKRICDLPNQYYMGKRKNINGQQIGRLVWHSNYRSNKYTGAKHQTTSQKDHTVLLTRAHEDKIKLTENTPVRCRLASLLVFLPNYRNISVGKPLPQCRPDTFYEPGWMSKIVTYQILAHVFHSRLFAQQGFYEGIWLNLAKMCYLSQTAIGHHLSK